MIKTISMSQYISMKARGWKIKIISAKDDEARVVLMK